MNRDILQFIGGTAFLIHFYDISIPYTRLILQMHPLTNRPCFLEDLVFTRNFY